MGQPAAGVGGGRAGRKGAAGESIKKKKKKTIHKRSPSRGAQQGNHLPEGFGTKKPVGRREKNQPKKPPGQKNTVRGRVLP